MFFSEIYQPNHELTFLIGGHYFFWYRKYCGKLWADFHIKEILKKVPFCTIWKHFYYYDFLFCWLEVYIKKTPRTRLKKKNTGRG